jgi:hypothetical protein
VSLTRFGECVVVRIPRFRGDGKGNDALCIFPNAKVLDFAVLVGDVGVGEEAARGEGVGTVNA